jgi:CHAT domain-containing protein/tetratricopeptide (TPR) repeat protein
MRFPKLFFLTIILLSALPTTTPLTTSYALAQSSTSDTRQTRAAELFRHGSQLYKASRFTEALIPFQQALDLYQQIGNHKGEGNTRYSIGDIYRNLRQYSKALVFYQQALQIQQKVRDRKSESITRNNMGLVYEELGQYSRALDYYQQALQIQQEVRDRVSEGTTYSNMGGLYKELGQDQKALDYLQQALRIRQEIRDREGEGITHNTIGGVYRKREQYSEALKSYRQALQIQREIRDRVNEGNTLNAMGLVYADAKEYQQALRLYEQVLQISQETRDRAGEAATRNNIGDIYRQQGQYPQALKFYRQALRITQEVRNLVGEAYVLNNIGATLVQSRQYYAAEQPLYQAISRFEQLRLGLKDREKITLNDAQKPPYRWLQTALIGQNKIAPALEVAERGRTRAFVELLTARSVPNPSQSRILQQLSQPLTFAQIQQVARQQDATLVEYSIVKENLYIWIVHPGGQVEFRKTAYSPETANLVQDLVSETGMLRQGARHFRTSSKPASQSTQIRLAQFGTYQLRKLHQMLIEPIVDLLPKNSNTRVIFIPQNELLLVPFPALMDAKGNYLIEQHTIQTAPSIQVLNFTDQHQQRLNHSSNRTALVVGNPVMPKLSTGRLLPLPAAEQEARTIAQLLNTKPMIGAAANKTAVLNQMPQARFIHLATHGLLTLNNGDAPGAIVLAPNHPNQVNDGLLTPAEILKMTLKAELVVLSACETAKGNVTSDGIVGLSRSLVAAGVPSVVVSLWNVNDESTSLLMGEFYRNLQNGSDRARALRQAMLTTMRNPRFAAPYDWAAFTLIGEAD